jgi:hypothetical protein
LNNNLDKHNAEFIFKKPLSKIKILSALVVLFLSTVYGWYYYEYHYLARQPIPMLKADMEPTRIKSSKPGGALVANTDKLVYNSLKNSKNDGSISLLPEPEEPLALHQKDSESSNDKIDDIIGNILSESENPPQTDIAKTEEIQLSEPIADTSGVKTLKIVQVQESDSKTHKKTITPKERPSYRMQLVSVRTEEAANKEWNRLKKLHSKYLASLPYIVQKVNIENKGIFYRLMAGKFDTFGQAKSVCKKLMSLQQNCVVIHY